MLYYKTRGKKIALTAHNVNKARRDLNDSALNRLTLRIQYHLSDHIFVHTQKMKSELVEDFGVRSGNVTVIPYGINNALPETDLTSTDAKRRLGIAGNEKTILFFGRIRPYKGLEHLLAGYQELLTRPTIYRLVIAGEPKKGDEQYLNEIQQTIRRIDSQDRIICKIQFIPDEEIETYLKAADVLVLPYREIFQSGILFMAGSFGLPVIAADVGSFKDEIIDGKTGFLCNPGDPVDLANTIEKYFASDLYKGLHDRRPEIRDYFNGRHSWSEVGEMTRMVYQDFLRSALQ
jgi:D-inositol-3-phosphate glycosyltransferase